MRLTFFAFAAVLVAFLAAPSVRADGAQFASAIDDLPLMEGLEETDAAPFETAHGRIVRIDAAGILEPASIAVFYVESLGQLGWRRLADAAGLIFVRADEQLSITIESPTAPDTRTRVTFLLTPFITPPETALDSGQNNASERVAEAAR